MVYPKIMNIVKSFDFSLADTHKNNTNEKRTILGIFLYVYAICSFACVRQLCSFLIVSILPLVAEDWAATAAFLFTGLTLNTCVLVRFIDISLFSLTCACLIHP